MSNSQVFYKKTLIDLANCHIHTTLVRNFQTDFGKFTPVGGECRRERLIRHKLFPVFDGISFMSPTFLKNTMQKEAITQK